MTERLLLYGLVMERMVIGALGTADPRVFARMFGIRHIALGLTLFVVRDNPRLLAKVAGVNAAVELADAAALLADERPHAAKIAVAGGLGCLVLSQQAARRARLAEANAWALLTNAH